MPSFPFLGAVISPPPVAGTVSYNGNSSSIEQPNGGSTSPACKASSGLEANPGKLLQG
jgi:histone acetyltransferase